MMQMNISVEIYCCLNCRSGLIEECFMLKVLRSPKMEQTESASNRQFEEKLGKRLMITCRSVNLTLQGCVNEANTEPVTNVWSYSPHLHDIHL